MSSLQRKVLQSNLPPLPDRYNGTSQSRFSRLVPKRKVKDYTSVDWDNYFDKSEDVILGENVSFHAFSGKRLYIKGITGPLLVVLHGGGHSALSWAVFSKSISSLCHCIIAAIDFRGHGHTQTNDDYNMAASVLAKDVADVLLTYFKELPPVVLLGHSMGGAIAVHIAVSNMLSSLCGLALIDVVEGTALDALSSMQSFLRSRPREFTSLENAIQWSIRSGQLRNLESAKVSMIGQLTKIPKTSVVVQDGSSSSLTSSVSSPIKEEEKEEEEENTTRPESKRQQRDTAGEECAYTWKVDLTRTEKYWRGWFENMTNLFLSASVPKLLVTAGIERLDKDMTIAQMQGKFQMEVLPNCGHMVHEDAPDKVAEIVTGFLLRQRLTQPKDNIQRHAPSC